MAPSQIFEKMSLRPYYHDERAGVTIYHGDALAVLPRLQSEIAALVIADAPYGERQAAWDEHRPPDAIWDAMIHALQLGGALYYWGFWGHADWVLPQARRVGLSPLSQITWWFQTGRPEKRAYREDTEVAWYFGKGEPITFNAEEHLEPYGDASNYARYNRAGKHPGTVWTASRIFHNHPENVGHETQKPLALISKMVSISSREGDLALDPFAGSGTTLLAAKRLGRRAIGIEIEERYCAIAARRLAQEVMTFEAPSPPAYVPEGLGI